MRRLAFVLAALVLASCTQGGEPEPTPDSSKSPEAVAVPDLIGLSLQSARVRLSDLGLELGEVSVVPGTYTDAAILQQHPPAGTEVNQGVAVDVISGPAAAAEGEEPPVVIHARQPKALMPDWADNAILTAFEAACPEGSPGRWGWSTTSIHPRPEGSDGPLPVNMIGTITCDDRSRHVVVVFFDAPPR
jgi:hypothetical protein